MFQRIAVAILERVIVLELLGVPKVLHCQMGNTVPPKTLQNYCSIRVYVGVLRGLTSQKKSLASRRTGDSSGPQPRAEAPASGFRFFSPPVSKPVASRSGSILSGRFTTLLAFLNIFAAAGDTTGVAGLSFQLLMVMANGGVGSYSRFNL